MTNKKDRGFTLIELVMTVFLGTTMLTLGTPMFTDVMLNNRMVTETNLLVSALNTARSEAIKRGERVTLCKSNDQTSCGDSSVNWEDGWIVFNDPNNTGVYDNGTEELLLVSTGLESDSTLRVGTNFSAYVSYLPSGRSSGNGGVSDTFRLCDERGAEHGRAMRINAVGRIWTAKQSELAFSCS